MIERARAEAKRRRKRAKRPLPTWTHPLIYGAVRGAAATTQIVGLDTSVRAMRSVGGAFAKLPSNRKRLARAVDNLAWCFPDWSPERRAACAVEAYRHLFSLAVEMSAAPRVIASDGYAAYVEWGRIGEGFRLICSERPALLVTGHCGNWELLGTVLAALGLPMHALYRPLDMKPLDEWAQRSRSARGLVLVDKFGAARSLPRLMRDKAIIGFIADQNAGDGGLFVPFFDRLASAYKTIGLLAMRYRAPVICGHAVRLHGLDGRQDREPGAVPPGFRYRVEINDIIRPEDWDGQPDPLFYITARYRRAIEEMVRVAPEQYLWMHRYWKSRPRHEREGRELPGRLADKIRALPWMDEHAVDRVVERSRRDAREMASR